VLTEFLYWIVFLFFITLIIRLVIDWIQVFAREWRPRGVALVVAEGVYSTTDPPLKVLRRVLPPLRIGPVMLDLAFILLFLICTILLGLLS
jgi:YggT family protein